MRVPPRYPERAANAGITGFVRVTFDIGLDGRVENAVVEESSPPGVFDDAALNAIRQWIYCPGSSRAEDISVTLKFELGS